MSETEQVQSTHDRVRQFPWLSTAVTLSPAAVAVEPGLAVVGLVAAPVVSPALGVVGAFNALDRKRSGLSRVFAAAAGVVGIGGTGLMIATAGPDSGLGPLIFPMISAPVAALFNVVSHLTRNVRFNFGRSQSLPATPKGP